MKNLLVLAVFSFVWLVGCAPSRFAIAEYEHSYDGAEKKRGWKPQDGNLDMRRDSLATQQILDRQPELDSLGRRKVLIKNDINFGAAFEIRVHLDFTDGFLNTFTEYKNPITEAFCFSKTGRDSCYLMPGLYDVVCQTGRRTWSKMIEVTTAPYHADGGTYGAVIWNNQSEYYAAMRTEYLGRNNTAVYKHRRRR